MTMYTDQACSGWPFSLNSPLVWCINFRYYKHRPKTTSDTFVGTLSLSAPSMLITMTCYLTKIGSLNIEGRKSRRFRQVNCDIERSVPTQCDWVCRSKATLLFISKIVSNHYSLREHTCAAGLDMYYVMHQSIPAVPTPPPPALVGHFPSLSVPGAGH